MANVNPRLRSRCQNENRGERKELVLEIHRKNVGGGRKLLGNHGIHAGNLGLASLSRFHVKP